MRKRIRLIGVMLLATVFFMSCSLNRKGNYLPPIKIEIPEILENNAEVSNFIEQSTVAINDWAIILEDLVVECAPYIGKTEVELSATEKEKLGKAMMDFVANMGEFAVKMAELEQTASTIEYNLSEEELEPWKLINTQFKNRIDELNKKYQDFGKEEE